MKRRNFILLWLPFHRALKTRNTKGDLVLIDRNHKDQHVWIVEEQRNYQRYLTECRHLSHCSSALFIEEANDAELKIYFDWRHKNPPPSSFPGRY